MKDIIFVTNYFGNGGAATVMKVIIENIPKNQYNVKLISFLDDKKIYKIPDNVEYIKLSKKSNDNKLKKIIKLRKILKRNKNATIVSFEYFINMRTIIASMFLKNKLIVSERNDPNKSGNDKRRLRNFLYGFANVLVCQTYDAKEYFPTSIKKKTVVIPNPVRTDLPTRYTGKRNNTIVTFCRIEKQKNLKMMIDSFKEVLDDFPNYKLVIYGDGSDKENIINYIKSTNLEDKVIMKNFKANLHKDILESAMFISTSDFEGISNSMLEAMSIGLPTICTDCPCGGARMVIKNGENGLLSPVNNSHEFANKMKEILKDENLSNKLSKNAEMIKEEYSPTIIYKEWIKIIE